MYNASYYCLMILGNILEHRQTVPSHISASVNKPHVLMIDQN